MAIKTKVPGSSWLKSLFGRKERDRSFGWNVNVLNDAEAEEKLREEERRYTRRRAHSVSSKLAELGCLTAVFLTAEMVQKGLYQELVRFYGHSLQYWLMSVSVSFGLRRGQEPQYRLFAAGPQPRARRRHGCEAREL